MKKFIKEFFELIGCFLVFGGIAALISYGLGSDTRGMCFWIGVSLFLFLIAVSEGKKLEDKEKKQE